MITTQEDPVVVEVTSTLHEWHKIWLSLYLDNQIDLFETIGSIILELIDLRTELISCIKQSTNTLHHHQQQQEATSKAQQIDGIKSDIIFKLDFGNRLLNLDLVPRDSNFKQPDPVELSPIKLFRLHSEAAAASSCTTNKQSTTEFSSSISSSNNSTNIYGYQEFTSSSSSTSLTTSNSIGTNSISSCSQSTTSSIYADTTFTNNSNNFSTLAKSTSTNSNRSISIQNCYHLQLCLKSHYLASLPADELVEIYFSIVDVYNNNPSTPVTEKFLIQVKGDEIVCGVPNTIFSNIGNLNNRDICLYIQVYRVGKMTLVDGYKTTFGKQTSGHNIQSSTNLNGSTNSVYSSNKFTTNSGSGLSRQSTINYFNTGPKYRRPFGSSMVLLKEYTKTASFKETCLGVKIVASNESEFSQLQELYTKRNQTTKMNQNLPNIQLDLSIKFIRCPKESIIRIPNHCLTEKRGFPDVVMPGDFKNDLFFTLESAEFEKGGKSISKNIEASVSLIDKTGLVIENCISPASNCDKLSSYNSCVFYHSNSPKWNESMKIKVPLSEFDSAHIRIEFRHCSTKDREKKFLGFSFLPLSNRDGAVMADDSHELYLYKCDSQLWEDESLNLCKYTSLPYGPTTLQTDNNATSKIISNQNNFTHSNREIVIVSTFLLSTKLTQNCDLLNLLKWRELIKRNNRDFEEALKKVLVLKGEEIVKFLQDILDTLFDTFTLYSTTEDDYSSLIFKVLIHIFLLLDEPKYQHFKPVLDTYASAHFSATLVYKGLLACVKNCLEYSSVVERQAPIQKCFKAIRYVFQFIVQSKLLFSKATGEHNDELFLNDLRHLFRLFEVMLANNNPKLIPLQVTFLESFPGTLNQLIKVVSAQELAKVVVSMTTRAKEVSLSRAKLIFMIETANSVLIKNQDTRLQITENFCKHLEYYLKHNEEIELCHNLLEILITRIHDYHWPCIYRLYQLTINNNNNNNNNNSKSAEIIPVMTLSEISMLSRVNQTQINQLELAITSVTKELEPFVNLLNHLLELLDKLVREFNNDKLLVQKYCTCLLTIFKLMSKINFDHYMRRREVDYRKLFNLFRSFRAIYNNDWSIMQITSHSILEHPIAEIFKEIRTRNEVTTQNNRQLSSHIKLLIDFITHPTLQLESFSDRKRNYIINVFGDLRIKFSTQLMRFWSELNESNICDLIPTSIQSFLDASLLPNDRIQQIIIPVFYDMIYAEDQLKSNSRQIERCLIDHLDLFLNLDRGNLNFVANFERILMNLIEEKSPIWKTNGINLIKSFSRLMRLLIEYRTSLDSFENRSKRMNCLVELLNFYKIQNRTDLHLSYLFKLCDMHSEVNNHVEAAFCLKLYTDEIIWCNRKLEPIEGYRPEEQEWVRKEALYQKMIHYFDIGKCWEEAISLCKELASFYETYLVDYEKVSSTLKKLASFLDNILTEHRPEREYFRVEFVGAGLPDYVRDKEFVYRGGEYERLAAFIQRMTTEFPNAEVLNSKSRQSISRDNSGQYMIISNVKPAPILKELFKSCQKNINDKIIHYYLNNRLDSFSYDKPIMKLTGTVPSNINNNNNNNTNNNNNQKDAGTSSNGVINVKNLWIGRYKLKLKKQLPGILPWSEVVSQEYEEISPINHAIETISNMNVELSDLILSYKTEPNKQISPLTMRLQGVIEAAVNGGPSVFVNAFLKRQPNDPESPHEPVDSLIKLRDLIKQQYNILDTGLAVHAKLAPPEVMPLHARLVERLQNTR